MPDRSLPVSSAIWWFPLCFPVYQCSFPWLWSLSFSVCFTFLVFHLISTDRPCDFWLGIQTKTLKRALINLKTNKKKTLYNVCACILNKPYFKCDSGSAVHWQLEKENVSFTRKWFSTLKQNFQQFAWLHSLCSVENPHKPRLSCTKKKKKSTLISISAIRELDASCCFSVKHWLDFIFGSSEAWQSQR